MSEKYVNRKDLRNALYDADAVTMRGVKMINEFPAADVVPVVRCRECVMARKPNRRILAEKRACEGTLICSCGFEHVYPSDGEELIFVDEFFYCAEGKRKDGGRDDV